MNLVNTQNMTKVIPFNVAFDFFNKLRRSGKSIVQCHGTFDLIHPGHIVHFEESSEQGDILVVTITGEKWVNKGPGRPHFNDILRSRTLAALEMINYVVIIPHSGAEEAIDCVKPNVYCKGIEYKNPNNPVTANVHNDIKIVAEHGGKVEYLGSIVYSSSKLINNHFNHLPSRIKDFTKRLSKVCTHQQFSSIVDDFSKLKILIVGDIIFDKYSYLNVQGLTSKNRILSGRFIREEIQAGGALAVFRHIKQFTNHVKLVSLIGIEPWVDGLLDNYINKSDQLIVRHADFTTIIKQRFTELPSHGKELSKLFSINYISELLPGKQLQAKVLNQIAQEINNFDLVVIADFGHGILNELTCRYIQDTASCLSVNCQTNSNNHGFNIINKKYDRADFFSLDQQEILLSCAKKEISYEQELKKLSKSLGSTYSWLTRGAKETIGVKRNHSISCPTLESIIIDTIGAGDAFFALVSMAAKLDLPLELSTFIGQLGGAQAVRILGNSEHISKQKLLKAGISLLNH